MTAEDHPPSWTASRKDMVGTTLGRTRLWFTIGEGMLTEVFYPRIDIAQIPASISPRLRS